MRYSLLGKTEAFVSQIGFGASPLGNVFGDVDASQAERTVHFAIDSGITFFDVAPYYGGTLAESRLGHSLRGRRHQIFLASKCGRYGPADFDFSPARIYQSIDESLSRLQTDYLDLLQLHDIEFGSEAQIIHEAVPALEAIRQAGKTRFIGITGYSLAMLCRVARACSIDTVLSYCHYNLLSNDLDTALLPVVQQKNLGLINASPLHMGILTSAGPPLWHPAPDLVRRAGKAVVDYCASLDLDSAGVALKFCLQHPSVATTVVGMASPEQVERNLAAIDLQPDPEIFIRLRQIAGEAHGLTWLSGRPENA